MNSLGFNILIADDDEFIPDLLKLYLNQIVKKDCSFDLAYSFKEAYERLLKDEYNLCIFDYNLGDGNGFDLLKKSNELNDTPSVILMSANVSSKMVERFYLNGAKLFIDKPLSFEQMESVKPILEELIML